MCDSQVKSPWHLGGGGDDDGGKQKHQHLQTQTCNNRSFIPQVLDDWIDEKVISDVFEQLSLPGRT